MFLRFILLFGLLLGLGASMGLCLDSPVSAEPVASVAEGDWHDRASLEAEGSPVLGRLPEFCAGAYIEPAFPFPELLARSSKFKAGLPVTAHADAVDYLVDQRMDLTGNVTIQQGNRTLTTASASIDERAHVIHFDQPVKLREPGFVMQGQRAESAMDSARASIEAADFLLYQNEFRGAASRIDQDTEGNLNFRNGRFTRCVPGNNNWSISSENFEIEKDAIFGVARNAVVRIKDVPVFYSPYLKFPVRDDRLSGWLTPEFGYSEEDGLDLSLPYYLNLAPNYDATVTPRYLSKRGAALELLARHLSYWSETEVGGGFLYRDDLYNGEFSRQDFDDLSLPGDFDPANRWLLNIDQRGQIGDLRTRIDFGRVSDNDYFRDLGNSINVASRVELEQRGELEYSRGGFYARLWTQGFQNLQEDRLDPYRRLPELDLSYRGHLAGPLDWSLGGKWSDFHRDQSGLTGSNRITGRRLHLEPRLQLPLAWPFGFLTVTGAYRYTRYELENLPTGFDEEPERKIGMGSIDGGLFFERDTAWRGNPVIQTLEPRIYYLYQTFADQSELPRFDASRLNFSFSQLFRDNRFSGIDRIGDANQVSTALTSRYLDADSGREYLRASLGAIFYLDDRRVTLSGLPSDDDRHSSSALVAEFAASLATHWKLQTRVIWDSHDNQVDESAYTLQYRQDNRHIFNLGFRTRNESQDISQSDVSLYWPVSPQWSFIGRWNYDLEFTRTIESFAGLEYNDCCWQLRLMGRRFIDNPANRIVTDVKADTGIFLQVVFKGLAGFGNKIDSVMEKGIRGYRVETYR